jgi:hypothetical protein
MGSDLPCSPGVPPLLVPRLQGYPCSTSTGGVEALASKPPTSLVVTQAILSVTPSRPGGGVVWLIYSLATVMFNFHCRRHQSTLSWELALVPPWRE